MTPIAAALADLQIGPPRSVGRLTVFPLVASAETEPSYLLLDEAIARGLASVTEVSASGSVPELRFENRAARPVLIVDGEAFLGAKQNRIANITILVPAHTATTIPVSCVERGRWAYHRQDFAPADHVLYSQTRAHKAQDVSSSLKALGQPRADQSAIWNEIASKSVRMSAESPSEAMEVMFARRRSDLDAFESALEPEANEAGAVFVLNGRIVGLELFDSSVTWRRFAPKVFRSYGLDALDEGVRVGSGTMKVDEWLRELRSVPLVQFPSIGLGQDVRFEHPRVCGGALIVAQTLVHCAAFDNAAWK